MTEKNEMVCSEGAFGDKDRKLSAKLMVASGVMTFILVIARTVSFSLSPEVELLFYSDNESPRRRIRFRIIMGTALTFLGFIYVFVSTLTLKSKI